MDEVIPFREAVDAIIEAGGEALRTCYQCGLCTGACPWNLVREFYTRELIHEAQIGLLLEVGDEENWRCATCGACVERCPRGVQVIDIFKAIRRIGIEYGTVPKILKTVMSGIKARGNPWNDDRDNRVNWTGGLDVKHFTSNSELLYFPCCTPEYDQKARRIAISTVSILKKANIDFGILGNEINCCGESVRKAGNEDLFQSLAHSNISTFKKSGVRKILVSSPHCYHTFKNEYREMDGVFEVVHITQFLAQLLEDGKIKAVKPFPKKVVYHDPCYLGRHNKIYEEPRKILKSIPGLELLELPDSHDESICCGGGGGRIWMETKKEERLSNLRLEQALEVSAEVLAISCPYCMLNFDDSLLASGKEGAIEVRDIVEILNNVIE